jgi:hypothetical protein
VDFHPNSAFRQQDGSEGMVFDYFFGFQQITK